MLLVALAAVLFVSTAARADVKPPEDYVEGCTLANVTRPAEECVMRSEHFLDVAAPEYLAKAGFCARCTTWGGTLHGRVYCRPKGGTPLPEGWEATLPADPHPDAPAWHRAVVPACPMLAPLPERDTTFVNSCRCSAAGDAPRAGFAAVLLLGVAAVARRATSRQRGR